MYDSLMSLFAALKKLPDEQLLSLPCLLDSAEDMKQMATDVECMATELADARLKIGWLEFELAATKRENGIP